MLQIVEPDTRKNYRTFTNNASLFHQALAFVKKGEKRFHVMNDAGPDFDIVYFRNQDWARAQKGYDVSSFFDEFDLYPPYEDYDENDADNTDYGGNADRSVLAVYKETEDHCYKDEQQ